jgi:phospholipase/lecithinase/hemolysin
MSKFFSGAGILCLLLPLWLSASSLRADQFAADHMVVFGDSLSDNGNLYTVIHLPVPPTYDLGRSTDGVTTYPASSISGLWEEQLAPSLGLAVPQPDLVNTVNLNFAFAGAETGAFANSASGPYGMAAQVQRYLDEKPAGIATAVHIFWGGTNDVFDYPDPLSAEKSAVANISSQIGSVARAGGRYFVWLNLFPLELTPRGAGNAAIKAACANFATDMPQAIADLQASNPGITIVPVDVYSLFKQITQAPAGYGFTNVTTQAQSFPVNPDEYLFWDYLHPTTRTHQVIANLALSDITRVLGVPSGQTRLPVSEDFTADRLNQNLWTVEAPPDATVTVASGHAVLSLPGGANHDAFLGGNQSARILQAISNVDLDVAAKFDSVPSSASAGQGILVQQDDGTYLRFEIASAGTQLLVSGASVAGGNEANYFSVPFNGSGPSMWLEVKRAGNTWTLNTSTDGVNYTLAGSFDQAIRVSAIGPYAWNYSGDAAATAAMTTQVDFFHTLSSAAQ